MTRALQVKEVENLIAQMVDVLTIVPVSPEALEPVLTKAREAGIVVISHEAQGITNVDYDVEAFDGAAYGAHLMDLLAESMGEEGDYIISVGSLTAASHMSWANGALARQLEAYPNMNCLNADAFIESNYNQKASQEKAAELMKTYPDLKGMFVTSATDLPATPSRSRRQASRMKSALLVTAYRTRTRIIWRLALWTCWAAGIPRIPPS